MSIKAIEYFLLNSWLWSMTWGIYHIPINILVMMLLLKFIARMKIIPSILMSFFAKVFSTVLYTLIILFLVFVVKLKFVFPDIYQGYTQINSLLACISLGVIYSFLQIIFFWIVSRFYVINVGFMVMISFASNIVSALLVYNFLDLS